MPEAGASTTSWTPLGAVFADNSAQPVEVHVVRERAGARRLVALIDDHIDKATARALVMEPGEAERGSDSGVTAAARTPHWFRTLAGRVTRLSQGCQLHQAAGSDPDLGAPRPGAHLSAQRASAVSIDGPGSTASTTGPSADTTTRPLSSRARIEATVSGGSGAYQIRTGTHPPRAPPAGPRPETGRRLGLIGPIREDLPVPVQRAGRGAVVGVGGSRAPRLPAVLVDQGGLADHHLSDVLEAHPRYLVGCLAPSATGRLAPVLKVGLRNPRSPKLWLAHTTQATVLGVTFVSGS